MCTLTAFGLQPMHYLYAQWKLCSSDVSPPSPSISLGRSGCEGGGHLGVQDPGGGAVWFGGLLVPMRGLELCWHHQEQPCLRSNCMSVPRLCVWESVCVWECVWKIERVTERKKRGEKTEGQMFPTFCHMCQLKRICKWMCCYTTSLPPHTPAHRANVLCSVIDSLHEGMLGRVGSITHWQQSFGASPGLCDTYVSVCLSLCV